MGYQVRVQGLFGRVCRNVMALVVAGVVLGLASIACVESEQEPLSERSVTEERWAQAPGDEDAFEVDEDEIEAILTRFGLRQAEGGWEVPSFRPDLTREVDLIEEVGRLLGLEHPRQFPKSERD